MKKSNAYFVTVLASAVFVLGMLAAGCSSSSSKDSSKVIIKPEHPEKHASANQCRMYDKRCALSVAKGDLEKMGKDAYKLEHEGHTYYFSDRESMAVFKEDLDGNIERANNNWGAFKWNQFQN